MKNMFGLLHRTGNRETLLGAALLAVTLLAAPSLTAAPSTKGLQYADGWHSPAGIPAVDSFNAWAGQYTAASSAVREGMIAQGVTLAQQRRTALAALIRQSPAKAFEAAVPAAVLGQLPAAVSAELETRVSGVGDLSVLIFCPNKNAAPVRPMERYVTVNGGTYQAFTYGRRLGETSKKGISVHGIAVDGVLALHEGALRELEAGETVPASKTVTVVPDVDASTPAGQPVVAEMGGEFYQFKSAGHLQQVEALLEKSETGLSPIPSHSPANVLQSPSVAASGTGANPSSAWTVGGKRILVIRVDFSDLPGDPTFPGGPAGTAANMQNLIDSQVSPYYAKSSYGQTTLTNVVTSQLYRMPQPASTYAQAGNNTGLHTDAEALAAANYNLATFDRIVVVFSYLGNLPGSLINYGGLAEITGPSVWINGEFDFRVVAHELGHTYGLYHAGLWQVTDGNPLSAGGSTIEYGDDFDTMGANFANSQQTDFSPFFKNQLGWLKDSQVRTISGNGVYRINTFDWGNYVDALNESTLALKVVRDSEHTYWVGIRRNFTGNAFAQNGAYVIWGLNTVGGGSGGGFQSQLLDFNTPGNAPVNGVNDDYDSALQFSQVLDDQSISLRLTPVTEGGSAPNTYVDIRVGNGGAPDFRVFTNSLPGGNGNGGVDPNECNPMFIVITNVGLVGGTNILATLSTTNANVIVSGKSSSYLNIAAGDSGTNILAFQFSTSPNFECGTPVNFTLVIKSDETTQTNTFSVASGSSSTPLRFDSVGTAPIPDLSTGDLPLVVSNFPSAILKATLSLHITHTFTSDLILQLISPDGTVYTLADHVGDSRDNFGNNCADLRTTFDDDAQFNIAVGAPPFIGSFQPQDRLSGLIGKSGSAVNGTWHLHVIDDIGIDIGTIQCWSLFLSTPACVDGGGECPGSDLAIGGNAAPEPVIVGNNLVYNLSVTNLGPKVAKGVTLTHLLPANVTFLSASTSQGSFAQSAASVNFNFGTLPVGSVATATVTVTPTQVGTITATASTAAVTDPDGDLSNNSVTITSHANPPASDVAVGIRALPNPVTIGNSLTYTISVTNNGPSAASGVVVSNNFTSSLALTSANVSQGTATIVGNVVLLSIGGMNQGAVVTATVTGIPSAEGQIVAKANVRANQTDPVPGNNNATVNTAVSAAADLGVGFQNVPASIVLGNNLTYTVSATNFGPSIATSVFLTQILPPAAQVVSSNSSLGTLSQSGNVMTCNVGSLGQGGVVTMTVVVFVPTSQTVTSSVTVSGGLADLFSANNSATATTIVAPPFVNVQPAGATLVTESIAPANGSIESGETVSVQFRLANLGNVATTNVMAKLLSGGGVTSPTTSTLVYGVLSPGGLPGSQLYSFTASGTNGGSVVATMQLSGDVSNTVSFTFKLPKATSFANTNKITIPDVGSASPYPSTITVSGVTGLVGKVTATLTNFHHGYPNDVSVLLVSPTGAKSVLMAHAGQFGSPVTGATFTFDDAAASPLPDSGSLSTGTWAPVSYAPTPVFNSPAPAGPYPAALSVFNNSNPNGVWSLYVVDESAGDSGVISNGWSLAITTLTPVNQTADLSISGVDSPDPVLAGDNLTYTFTVTNNGTNAASNIAFTNVLPANVRYLSTTVSQGSYNTNAGTVYANLGSLNVGASATVTIVVSPNTSGVLTTTASVSASQNDLVPNNNSVTLSTTANLPVADLSIVKSASADTVVTGSNFVYTLSVVNNGPGKALNAVVTDVLPAGLAYVSSSAGTFASGTLTVNLGTLNSGAGSAITITTHPTTTGTIVNTATASTTSSDSNTNNNSSSATITARLPKAAIVTVNAALVSESQLPADGTVSAGETVTVALGLANTGEIDTTSLVATLANTGGVTASSGAVNYGALVHNGAAVSRNFTFTAGNPVGGVIVATLSLQDGANNLGSVTFNFTLPQTNSFANTNAIIIPDHGSAAPYPSAITVSGLSGYVSKVSVTLNGITHAFPKDIGVLLVSPTGAKSVVMAGAGGGNSVSNLTVSFYDAAAGTLSDTTATAAGDYKPASFPASRAFPSPAPAGQFTASFAQFNGGTPNGDWSLYVVDDVTGDGGIISRGWTLNLTVVTPVNPTVDLAVSASANPAMIYVGHNSTYSIFVTNQGPNVATGVIVTDTLPAGATLDTVTVSKGGFTASPTTVTFNVGTLNVGEGAQMDLLTTLNVAGPALNSAIGAAAETDLNFLNNAASATVTVLPVIPARLTGVLQKANNEFQLTLTGQPNLSYIIQSSTNIATSAGWKSISTNTAGVDGVFQFNDANSSASEQRFYRAVIVP
ncbi:MAG: proprotein convertase P-domain-containing protein [Verrucomicrobiota bacterium]